MSQFDPILYQNIRIRLVSNGNSSLLPYLYRSTGKASYAGPAYRWAIWNLVSDYVLTHAAFFLQNESRTTERAGLAWRGIHSLLSDPQHRRATESNAGIVKLMSGSPVSLPLLSWLEEEEVRLIWLYAKDAEQGLRENEIMSTLGTLELQLIDTSRLNPRSPGTDCWLNDTTIAFYLALVNELSAKLIEKQLLLRQRIFALSPFFFKKLSTTSVLTKSYIQEARQFVATGETTQSQLFRWVKGHSAVCLHGDKEGNVIPARAVLIPFNITEAHFYCVTLYPYESRAILYDSMPYVGVDEVRTNVLRLIDWYIGNHIHKRGIEPTHCKTNPETWAIETGRGYQQTNGSDCGMAVLLVARDLFLGRLYPAQAIIRKSDSEYYRKLILLESIYTRIPYMPVGGNSLLVQPPTEDLREEERVAFEKERDAIARAKTRALEQQPKMPASTSAPKKIKTTTTSPATPIVAYKRIDITND